MRSKEWLRSFQVRKLNGFDTFCVPVRGLVSQTITRRSGSWNGRRCSMAALTTLKIAVLAPMPSASVRAATAVKPGLRAQFARGVADVLQQIAGPGERAALAAGVGGDAEAARFHQGGAARFR